MLENDTLRRPRGHETWNVEQPLVGAVAPNDRPGLMIRSPKPKMASQKEKMSQKPCLVLVLSVLRSRLVSCAGAFRVNEVG